MAVLPKDTLFEIFSRTAIKYLARCRCVCKEWCKHNNDPDLEKIRVKDEPTPIMFKQFLDSHTDIHCKFSFLRSMEYSTSSSMKVTEDPVLEFCQKDSFAFGSPKTMILGSCHGLILVHSSNPNDHHNHEISLAMIDPLSKIIYELPPIKSWSGVQPVHLCSAGIGFDDSTNSFKVICVINENSLVSPNNIDVVREKECTMVHVLGSGSGSGSWSLKEISEVKSYPITGEGIFAHGYLYWLVDCFDYNRTPPIDEGRQVVRFDMKTEEYELIDPPKLQEDGWTNDQLVDLNDEVGYVYNNVEKLSVEVWILKQKEWVMHRRLDQAPNGPVWVSGCWNKEGDILLTCGQGKHMYVYGLKTGDLKVIYREDECEAKIRMYRNSLLSIHGINSNAHLIKC